MTSIDCTDFHNCSNPPDAIHFINYNIFDSLFSLIFSGFLWPYEYSITKLESPPTYCMIRKHKSRYITGKWLVSLHWKPVIWNVVIIWGNVSGLRRSWHNRACLNSNDNFFKRLERSKRRYIMSLCAISRIISHCLRRLCEQWMWLIVHLQNATHHKPQIGIADSFTCGDQFVWLIND